MTPHPVIEQQLDTEAMLRRHLRPLHPVIKAALLAAIDGQPHSRSAVRKVLRSLL